MANLCARFDEHQIVLLSLLLALRRRDLALVVQISLVPHKHNDHIIAALAAYVVDPLAGVLEGFRIWKASASGIFVAIWGEGWRDRLEMSYTTTATLESRM
jgi:hypothetical protein